MRISRLIGFTCGVALGNLILFYLGEINQSILFSKVFCETTIITTYHLMCVYDV